MTLTHSGVAGNEPAVEGSCLAEARFLVFASPKTSLAYNFPQTHLKANNHVAPYATEKQYCHREIPINPWKSSPLGQIPAPRDLPIKFVDHGPP